MRKLMVTERLTLRPLELHDAESMEKLAGEKEGTLTEDNAFLGVVGLHVNKRHNMAELAYGENRNEI